MYNQSSDERVRNAFRTLYKLMNIQIADEHIEHCLTKLRQFSESAKTSATHPQLPQGRYHLLSADMWTGITTVPTALIVLQLPNGEVRLGKGTGKGIIDACCRAFIDIVGQDFAVTRFTGGKAEEYTDKGSEAEAKVQVVIEIEGKAFAGEGIDTDTLCATALALVDGLNKAVEVSLILQN